ncbi:SPOR domain-containing protein [Rubellimicrobium roseum]|uniref:SPOR domain-containing protein n=1 Tax=Rubellimicrobium roseum TaxID=687525 RepID=A0A5C4NDT8_9RHOB|nr:SPOR domain-containing protein [Rubellimicrobium roseum]TNC71498.1 hypothetical protein FHG71_11175 [Rubellimicrobium roseum]
MATGFDAIRQAGVEAVRSHLVPVVTALGLAMALVWAPSDPVATAPAPLPRSESRPMSVCLASPVAKRPCELPRREASAAPVPIKARQPLPPLHWLVDAGPVRPAGLAGVSDWVGPGRLTALSRDAAPEAFETATPTLRPAPLAWAGAVRPVPRGADVASLAEAAPRQVARRAVPVESGPLHVQVGTYADGANADRAVAALKAMGFGVGERAARAGAMRAVAAGPFASESEAAVALAALRAAGFVEAYLTR